MNIPLTEYRSDIDFSSSLHHALFDQFFGQLQKGLLAAGLQVVGEPFVRKNISFLCFLLEVSRKQLLLQLDIVIQLVEDVANADHAQIKVKHQFFVGLQALSQSAVEEIS